MNAAAFPPGIFAPLPVVEGGFQCVVADVPSRFRSNSKATPGRNAIRHYNCHSMPTIASLPVRNVVARNAFLWFWTTGPLIAIGAHIPVIRAWGFEPTAMGFVWVKLNPKAPSLWFGERDLFFGPGLTTRKNAEYVVLCRRGHPPPRHGALPVWKINPAVHVQFAEQAKEEAARRARDRATIAKDAAARRAAGARGCRQISPARGKNNSMPEED